MPNPEQKYQLEMSFRLRKQSVAGEKQPEMWRLNNVYDGMDYGQIVTAQSACVMALSKALTSIGILQAEGLGFSVAEVIEQLQQFEQQAAVRGAERGSGRG